MPSSISRMDRECNEESWTCIGVLFYLNKYLFWGKGRKKEGSEEFPWSFWLYGPATHSDIRYYFRKRKLAQFVCWVGYYDSLLKRRTCFRNGNIDSQGTIGCNSEHAFYREGQIAGNSQTPIGRLSARAKTAGRGEYYTWSDFDSEYHTVAYFMTLY